MSGFWESMVLGTVGLGFGIGHLRHARTRWLCFVVLLVFPVLALLVTLALTPPGPSTIFEWGIPALVMIAPVISVWICLSTAAFVAARWILR